jgi:hypothetical protein
VRSFRRNLASARQSPQSSSAHHQDGGVKEGRGAKGCGCAATGEGGHKGGGGGGGLFVKINMDGVPIGRKVDLTAYGGYAELSAAVGKLFRGLLAGTPRDPSRPVCSKKCVCSSSRLNSNHAGKNQFSIAQLRGTRPLLRWAVDASRRRRGWRPRSP